MNNSNNFHIPMPTFEPSQLKEQRFVITAQLPNNKQISWADLVGRLTKLGYL